MEIRISAKEIESMKSSYLPIVDTLCVSMGMGKPERNDAEWEDVIAVGSSIKRDQDGNFTIRIEEECVVDFTTQTSGFLAKIAAKASSLMIFAKGLFSEIIEAFDGFEKKWGVNESLLTEEQRALLDKEMTTWWNNEIKFRQDAGIALSGIEAAAERERDHLLHVMLGRVRDSEGKIIKFEPKESEFCHSRIH